MGENGLTGTIIKSYATGDIVMTRDGWNIGGLVGINKGVIKNSYATGRVIGNGRYIGGWWERMKERLKRVMQQECERSK